MVRSPMLKNERVNALDKLGQISDNPQQIDGMATEMNLESVISTEIFGATRRIRTDDLLITNQLLYQLS
jgi:hypothetical protein